MQYPYLFLIILLAIKSFLIKTLNSLDIEEVSQHDKGHLWKTHSSHYNQWGKTESLFLKSGPRQGYSLSLLFHIVLEVLARTIRQEK